MQNDRLLHRETRFPGYRAKSRNAHRVETLRSQRMPAEGAASFATFAREQKAKGAEAKLTITQKKRPLPRQVEG